MSNVPTVEAHPRCGVCRQPLLYPPSRARGTCARCVDAPDPFAYRLPAPTPDGRLCASCGLPLGPVVPDDHTQHYDCQRRADLAALEKTEAITPGSCDWCTCDDLDEPFCRWERKTAAMTRHPTEEAAR